MINVPTIHKDVICVGDLVADFTTRYSAARQYALELTVNPSQNTNYTAPIDTSGNPIRICPYLVQIVVSASADVYVKRAWIENTSGGRTIELINLTNVVAWDGNNMRHKVTVNQPLLLTTLMPPTAFSSTLVANLDFDVVPSNPSQVKVYYIFTEIPTYGSDLQLA